MAVMFAAALPPAIRAAHTDPVTILRTDYAFHNSDVGGVQLATRSGHDWYGGER
jgi:hypothetical protein